MLTQIAPEHVAIVMDGNRRWATEKGLPPSAGHWQGAETLFHITKAAIEIGVKTLTVYSFSTENFGRSKEEVESVMEIFKVYLENQRNKLRENGVRLTTIGDLSRFPKKVLDALEETIEVTKQGTKLELILALGYGGRDEICRAMNRILEDQRKGVLKDIQVTEDMMSSYLDTSNYKDPDLLIRTGGCKRLSNFLLWQVAYSEMFHTNVLWPDFSKEHLLDAIGEFHTRDRRFGK